MTLLKTGGIITEQLIKPIKNLPHYLKIPLSVRSIVENALAMPGTFLKRMK